MRTQKRTLAKLMAFVMVITTMLGSSLTSVTAYAEDPNPVPAAAGDVMPPAASGENPETLVGGHSGAGDR